MPIYYTASPSLFTHKWAMSLLRVALYTFFNVYHLFGVIERGRIQNEGGIKKNVLNHVSLTNTHAHTHTHYASLKLNEPNLMQQGF